MMPIPTTDTTRTPVERAFYESFIIGNRWSVTRLYAQNMSASRTFKNELRHLAYERGVNLRHMDKEIEATRRELDHIHIGEEDLLYLPTEEEKQTLEDVKENIPQVGMKWKGKGNSWKYSGGMGDPLGVRGRSGSRIREISRVERGFLGMVHLYLHQRRRGSSKAFSNLHLDESDGGGEDTIITERKQPTEGGRGKLQILDNAKSVGDAVKHMKMNQVDDYYKNKIMKLGENLASMYEQNKKTESEKTEAYPTDGRRRSVTPSQDRAKTPKSRSPSLRTNRKPSLMFSKEASELPSNTYNAILTQSRNKFLALTESDQNSDRLFDVERESKFIIPSITTYDDRVPATRVVAEKETYLNMKSNEAEIREVKSPIRTLDCIPEILPSLDEEGNDLINTFNSQRNVTEVPRLMPLLSLTEIPNSDSSTVHNISSNMSSGRRVSFAQPPIRNASSASPVRKTSSATVYSRENSRENKSSRKISSATSLGRKLSCSHGGGRRLSSVVSSDTSNNELLSSSTTSHINWNDDPGWEEHRRERPINQPLPPISSFPSNQKAAVPQRRPSRVSLDPSLNRKSSMVAPQVAGQDRQRSKSLPGVELPLMFDTSVGRHTDGVESNKGFSRRQSCALPPISRSTYNNFYNEKDLKDTTAKYISRHMKVDITKLTTPLST